MGVKQPRHVHRCRVLSTTDRRPSPVYGTRRRRRPALYKAAFHDTDINTDTNSPDTPTSLRPTHAISSRPSRCRVSVSWNAAFIERDGRDTARRAGPSATAERCHGCIELESFSVGAMSEGDKTHRQRLVTTPERGTNERTDGRG